MLSDGKRLLWYDALNRVTMAKRTCQIGDSPCSQGARGS